MSLNLVYDRTEEDETSAAAIRSAYQKLGNWSGLTDAERAQLERGALTYNTLNRVEQAVKTLAAALTSAGYPVEVTPVLKGASRLPTGYTEVEYIESSGTQYIDTGVPAKDITDSFIDFRFISVGTAELQVMAAFTNSSNRLQCGWNGSAFYTGYGATYSQTSNATARTTATCVPVGSPTSTVYLFAQNQSDAPKWQCKAEIYECTMSTAAGKVRDFVPCKNPSGAVGLYDLVGGQFYGNTGTGSFTAGAEVGKAEDREWQEGDVLYRPQWTTYLDNVQRLRDAYYTLAETGELPEPGDKLGYEGANTIEKVLADIDLLLDGMKSSYRRCGAFRAGNNAAHLPLKGSI